jgi:DNA-binding protein H-NS
MSSALEELKRLEAQMAELRKSAALEIAAKKDTAIREVMAIMMENEVTLLDLEAFLRKQAAKYTDGVNTWSGKGKRPSWLTKALASGKALKDFEVQPANLQKELKLAA